jgi:mono/diheme cytochrome c family protein
MEMRTRLGLLVAALTCIAAAPAAAQAKLPAGVTPAMITKGKTIFTSTGLCFACHGMDAKGMVGPNLTDQTWIHGKGSYPRSFRLSRRVSRRRDKTGKGAMPSEGRLADQRGRREGGRRVCLVAEQPDLKHQL